MRNRESQWRVPKGKGWIVLPRSSLLCVSSTCVIGAPSARKHGTSVEDAKAAAQTVFVGGPLNGENPQRELRIGIDAAGRLLEIWGVMLCVDSGTCGKDLGYVYAPTPPRVLC